MATRPDEWGFYAESMAERLFPLQPILMCKFPEPIVAVDPYGDTLYVFTTTRVCIIPARWESDGYKGCWGSKGY